MWFNARGTFAHISLEEGKMKRFFRSIVPALALVWVWGIGLAHAIPLVTSPGLFTGDISVAEEGLETNTQLLLGSSSVRSSVRVGAGITTYHYTVSARGLSIVQGGSSDFTSDVPDGAILLNRIVIQTGELLEENIVSLSHPGTYGEWDGPERGVRGIRFDGLSCVLCMLVIETNSLPVSGGLMADGANADGDIGLLFSAFIGELPVTPLLNDPRSFGRILVPGSELNTFTVTAVPEAPTLALFLAGFVCLICRRGRKVA